MNTNKYQEVPTISLDVAAMFVNSWLPQLKLFSTKFLAQLCNFHGMMVEHLLMMRS